MFPGNHSVVLNDQPIDHCWVENKTVCSPPVANGCCEILLTMHCIPQLDEGYSKFTCIGDLPEAISGFSWMCK